MIGTMTIVDELNENTSLKELGIRSIGRLDALTIVDSLQYNRSLTSMNLCQNHLNTIDCKTIANTLIMNNKNSVLVATNLSENRMGDEGYIAIVEALKTNNMLQFMYMVLVILVIEEL